MDAIRLIEAARRALAEAREVREIVTEAWQAQALAEAIGSRLAMEGAEGLRGAASALSEPLRRCGSLRHPDLRSGSVRAAGLTGIPNVHAALRELRGLLEEVGVALVAVAVSAEEEPVYWQCIDGVDAVDESKDRVLDLLKLVGAEPVGLEAEGVAPGEGAGG